MQNIFNIQTEADFQKKCLETFRYQYKNQEVYRKFVDYLNINPDEINDVEKIPFLPIEMFKNHLILDENSTAENYFQSSGTTQMTRSKHYIADFGLYEQVFTKVSRSLSVNRKSIFSLVCCLIILKIRTRL